MCTKPYSVSYCKFRVVSLLVRTSSYGFVSLLSIIARTYHWLLNVLEDVGYCGAYLCKGFDWCCILVSTLVEIEESRSHDTMDSEAIRISKVNIVLVPILSNLTKAAIISYTILSTVCVCPSVCR